MIKKSDKRPSGCLYTQEVYMKRKGGSLRKPQAVVYGRVLFRTVPLGSADTAFAGKMWRLEQHTLGLIDPTPTTTLREEP
jgi:hypothetical protein